MLDKKTQNEPAIPTPSPKMQVLAEAKEKFLSYIGDRINQKLESEEKRLNLYEDVENKKISLLKEHCKAPETMVVYDAKRKTFEVGKKTLSTRTL